ncbi:MAG: hypothetical protein [Microviridae sp.]|nr:MAG: hypothetical protein [Microviridae sp.]
MKFLNKKRHKRARKVDTNLENRAMIKATAKVAYLRKHEAIKKPLRPVHHLPFSALAFGARGLQVLKNAVSSSSLPVRRLLHTAHAYTLINPNKVLATATAPRLRYESNKRSPCSQRRERRKIIMIKTRGRGMRVKRAKWNETSKIVCKG